LHWEDQFEIMTADAVTTHGQCLCQVEFSDEIDDIDERDELGEAAQREVDAGAELAFRVRVACPQGCDLSGQIVSIRDHDDAELASAPLAALDEGTCLTDEIVVRAPLKVGEYVYRAVLPAHEDPGVLHEEISTRFSLVARAHAARVTAWGWPSAIEAGEPFTLKVGIKCSSGCNLSGRGFRVLDQDGAEVAAGTLRDEIWPGTSALYFAEVEAVAPSATGDYRWSVETAGSDSGLPHATGMLTFGVKVVSPPDCVVTVAVFDGQKRTPVKGAHVLLHPYRAFTDENGVARVKVAKGSYRLAVSGFKYIAYSQFIDVAGDVSVRAELATEPEGLEDIYG
jgi:hypothetical protein